MIAAARREFFVHGFRRVSMDDLAAELRMSKKTLYASFPSKSSLVEAVLKAKFDDVEADLFDGLASGAVLGEFADLKEASGEGPEAGARFVGALLEQHLPAVLDNDRDDDTGVHIVDEAAVLALETAAPLGVDVALDEEVGADLAEAGR